MTSMNAPFPANTGVEDVTMTTPPVITERELLEAEMASRMLRNQMEDIRAKLASGATVDPELRAPTGTAIDKWNLGRLVTVIWPFFEACAKDSLPRFGHDPKADAPVPDTNDHVITNKELAELRVLHEMLIQPRIDAILAKLKDKADIEVGSLNDKGFPITRRDIQKWDPFWQASGCCMAELPGKRP